MGNKNQTRYLERKLQNHFKKMKQAIILLGARQVGKTTLLRHIFSDALYLLVDEENVMRVLESYNSDTYKQLIRNHKQIIIDELHLLSDPGRVVKIIYDQFDNMEIIVTGSSSLHIKNKTAESMAGRAIDYHIYPLTYWEYLYQQGIEDDSVCYIHKKILTQDTTPTIKLYDQKEMVEQMMLYGQYPEVLNTTEVVLYLENLAQKAIYKDILALNLINDQAKALQLLRLLAYQIGNIVNYTELARKLEISSPTVQRYIEIFEQSYILYRIYPFSKGGRDEIGRAPKIYFWDLGLRNALIENFQSITGRPDLGACFENFIINEVKKEIEYDKLDYRLKFWRTKSGSEVDLVLHNNNEIIGCEIKYTRGSVSQAFKNRYPEAKTHVVTVNNFV